MCLACLGLGLLAGAAPGTRGADAFRIASYNVENYLLEPVGTRPAKSAESRRKIRESLRIMNADVVALQEVGGAAALDELRGALEKEGLSYPHWDLVTGFDTNIQVAVLSRYPFLSRVHHTNEVYLLEGRRFRVSRGFLEVTLEVAPRYRVTLLTAHLKSRLPVPYADEADMREHEARLLRERIDALLKSDPAINLAVVGDFNDGIPSRPLRLLLGRGRTALVDSRPAERNGDRRAGRGAGRDSRDVAWTHYYAREDTYSRLDYILLSSGLAREWLPDQTYVLTVPNWGEGSDHRPVTAGFEARDR